MSVFLGNTGNIRLRRAASSGSGSFADQIRPDDVITGINRIGLDRAYGTLVTGDSIEISTLDPRGLVCFAASNWINNAVQESISGYINVNAAGGLRFFPSFADAVNNNRSAEYDVAAFAGDPLEVIVSTASGTRSILGNVISYELNTSREAIDTTALADRFKSQYSAGLISGSGRIECFFDPETTGIRESSLLLLQTILRVEIGSTCDLALYLLDSSLDSSQDSVFYEFQSVITQSGITVDTNNAINCSIDFLTTGEINLKIGQPSGYILKEDTGRIQIEPSLGFLLKEQED